MRWPADIKPSTNELSLHFPSKSFKSPFTGVMQSVALPGARWELKISVKNLKKDMAKAFESFTDDLRGGTEPIQIMDHARPGREALGVPVVAVASKGRQLQTSGWNKSMTVLNVGDLIEVNGELKRVRCDVKSNALGLATIEFNPPLRKLPAVGARIITLNPCMWATLDSDSVVFKRGSIYTDASLKFVEAIYR